MKTEHVLNLASGVLKLVWGMVRTLSPGCSRRTKRNALPTRAILPLAELLSK